MEALNEFLTEKGVSTHLRHKRELAKAFGIPFDKGTPAEDVRLLMALRMGEKSARGEITESYQVEKAFTKDPAVTFETLEDANKFKSQASGQICRVLKLTTISEVI